MASGAGGFRYALTAGTATTGGTLLNLANPEGADLLITRFLVNVTTPATGAATADFGIAATLTKSDTLLDGIDIGTAAALFDSAETADYGTNGHSSALWPAASYLTGSPGATAAGLVGYVYIDWIHL